MGQVEKGTVLIVDDESTVRESLRLLLGRSYEVDAAESGENALEHLEASTSNGSSSSEAAFPDLVLLDVMMPKMNGLEVLEKIKKDPDLKRIPVIMLTNLAGQQDIDRALELGAVKYIVKSEYDPKQISDMVKEIISAHTRDDVPKTANV